MTVAKNISLRKRSFARVYSTSQYRVANTHSICGGTKKYVKNKKKVQEVANKNHIVKFKLWYQYINKIANSLSSSLAHVPLSIRNILITLVGFKAACSGAQRKTVRHLPEPLASFTASEYCSPIRSHIDEICSSEVTIASSAVPVPCFICTRTLMKFSRG